MFTTDFVPSDVIRQQANAAAIVAINKIRKQENDRRAKRNEPLLDDLDDTDVLFFENEAAFRAACPTAPAPATYVTPTKGTYGFVARNLEDNRLCEAVDIKTVTAANPAGTIVTVEWATLKAEEKAKAEAGKTILVVSSTPAGISVDTDGGIWIRQEDKTSVSVFNETDWRKNKATAAAMLAQSNSMTSYEVAVQTNANKVTAVKNDALIAFASRLVKEVGVTADQAIAFLAKETEVA